MHRHRKRLALAVLLAAALAIAAGEKPAPTPPTPKPSVAELIEQLNSRDFKKREAATRALMKRDDALPALREALKSTHAEVRRRAALILDQRENGTKRRVLKRALACIKNGYVDQALDLLTAEPDCGDSAWQPLLDLAKSVALKGKEKYDLKYLVPVLLDKTLLPPQDPKRKGLVPGMTLADRRIVTRGAITRDFIARCEIICGGPLRVKSHFTDNIVFVNGDVTIERSSISRSFVLCDGNITTNDELANDNSVLIATGTVKAKDPLSKCLIIEHADMQIDLRQLRLYGLDQAGVEVAAEKGGLVAKKVLPAKPLAAAGLRPGDRLLALDGTKIKDEAQLRRLLRRKTAFAEKATLTVERAGQGKLHLTVSPAD
jgi:hypothetical protein